MKGWTLGLSLVCLVSFLPRAEAGICDVVATDIQIRSARRSDLPVMIELEKAAWGDLGATDAILESRMQVFPEGQLVAVNGAGQILGFMNLQKLNEREFLSTLASGTQADGSPDLWNSITDNGMIRQSHRPDGDILCGINLTTRIPPASVPGKPRRSSYGAILIRAAQEFARKNHIHTIYGLTRVNGLRAYAEARHIQDFNPSSPTAYRRVEEYVAEVAKGNWTDPALSFHMRQGAVATIPIAHSMADDQDSLQWGVLIRYDVSPGP